MSGTDPESTSIRVLHVDDEPDFADLTAVFLERERDDFAVATATSATDGLDHLAEAEPAVDCIVSDYDMPGMDGLEFFEAICESHPLHPFILFTGRGGEGIASEAITAGVDEYLTKKSGIDQYTLLANRIDNLVAQYRSEPELRISTERLRKPDGDIADVIFTLDTEWRVTYLNDQAEKLFDRTEAEVIGENVWEQFPEAIGTTFQDEYERAMHRRVPVEFEEFYPPLDTMIEVRAVPTGNGLTVHLRDSTENKERERETQRQNEPLRPIVDNAPVMLFALNEEDVFTLSEEHE
jgi:CheY-like chemotaxis protein